MTISISSFLCVVLACALIACAGESRPEPSHGDKPLVTPDKAPTNHLAGSSSPYLLQHAHNPVNWYPWGPQALARAKRENKPIFLSIGYATCHWCHVMAHESFENARVADILNKHYIAIKVDREQRPDLDSQYMLATQLMTGRGGWPNSLWLTPDGRPWFAGTYFPREDRAGQPGFITVLSRLAEVWQNQRDQVEQQADQLAQAIRQYASVPPAQRSEPLRPGLLRHAVEQVVSHYDAQHGGFGHAPKFPPHATLRMIAALAPDKDDSLRAVFTGTLDAMADGGMYDHIGFGFHRYATDARWLVPHFEKMLYDNAQLIAAYTAGYRLTGRDRYRRIVDQTVQWLDREMTDPAGGFYCALDADSEGAEGRFYLWRYDEIVAALGAKDAELFCSIYNISPAGNFADETTGRKSGANIPHLTRSLADWADAMKTDASALSRRLDAMRVKLLAVRARRVRPACDDKVLAGWNGLMIAALADAGRILDRPGDTARAVRAADFILQHMRDDHGRLLRCWRAGKATGQAYLDDYADLLGGLIALHQATDSPRWLDAARRLADQMIDHFEDRSAGGFFFTADDHEPLLGRSKNPLGGGNVPDPNGAAGQALFRLGQLAGEPRYTEAARKTVVAFAPLLVVLPDNSADLALAAHLGFQLTGETSFAVGPPDPISAELLASHLAVQPGQTFQLAVRITIAPGFHIYAADLDQQVIATQLTAQPIPDVTFGPVRWPQPTEQTDPVLGQSVKTYSGHIVATLPVTIGQNIAGPLHIDLRFTCQPCDTQRCLQPRKHTLSIDLPVAKTSRPDTRHADLFSSVGAEP